MSAAPSASKPKSKSFDAIPEPAKRAYERLRKSFAAEGRKYTPSQYAEDYWSFDALPDDAKQTYERMRKFFAAKRKQYTPEEFAKGYWDEIDAERSR